VIAELDATPIAAEEEALPLRSNEFCTAYSVRFTSIGPYRLFGYLSIPKGEGPFPTLVYLTRCQSVVEIIPQGDANEKRGRFAVFSLSARGQRMSDQPYAASYPGAFVEGIEDPRKYLFRGIVADCCRAVDYAISRPEVDRTRVAGMVANDLPLITSALRGGLTHLIASPDVFYGPMDRLSGDNGYPLDEFNDYLRAFPDRREVLARTLAYYETLFFAESVKVPALLWGDPAENAPLGEVMGAGVALQASEHSRYKDGMIQENWIAEQFGLPDTILPSHWK
jgi:cephalosporin-C deacetylase